MRSFSKRVAVDDAKCESQLEMESAVMNNPIFLALGSRPLSPLLLSTSLIHPLVLGLYDRRDWASSSPTASRIQSALSSRRPAGSRIHIFGAELSSDTKVLAPSLPLDSPAFSALVLSRQCLRTNLLGHLLSPLVCALGCVDFCVQGSREGWSGRPSLWQ